MLSAEQSKSLPEEVKSKYAKIMADQLLTVNAIFERDSKRLDQKQRAVYRNLGLKLEPTEDDMHIVADNITIGSQQKKPNGWLMPALLAGAIATGGSLGIGFAVLKLLDKEVPPVVTPDPMVDTDTRRILRGLK